ncbi:uncharacterized protein PV07_06126 [Cladophialophora immunda]|uniref:C2H2-type domain-containing protein n=1 Tax=Cladophialophora immunda TaxID=569365 RepID=A0A0D2AYK8_9EURO|nr:uncharacterized protein PV07_06126 [Cladophialophora immunda]KIW30377.1 hypothetical protein PV07_06126 [Cladophialophora immunda]
MKAHVRNMHVAPLVCTHPGCSYKKPFGKPCDLKRHLATVHNTIGGYPCLESDCTATFSRKDKMMKHAREKHELFKCPHNHCSATVFAVERESHLRESHGRYECAIGSCISTHGTHKSCFTERSLSAHLRTCHRITFESVSTLLNSMSTRTRGDSAFTATLPWFVSYRDCLSCLTQSRAAQKSRLGGNRHFKALS